MCSIAGKEIPMNAMAIRRLILMAVLCLAPIATRAATTSGWLWFVDSQPYFYTVNETNWVYINESAESVWFYNFGTATWTNEGPAGWAWATLPYVYSATVSAWIYILFPAEGVWFYHYSDGSWEHVT
jgi:hypothetical protein